MSQANIIGDLHSAPVMRRYAGNPVLDASMVPYDAMLVFNAGVCRFQGRYVMVFRNDYGSVAERRLDGTNMGLAFSDDGLHWQVQPKPCFAMQDAEITRAYDPRLTVIDGRCYMCFAIDTHHGVCGGVAVTDDFEHFDILSTTAPDNRNLVLFPERIGGNYVRLERPMPVYGRGGCDAFDIWLSRSPDLRLWDSPRLVLGLEQVPYANNKIGPGAPPIKTSKGWLTAFHAVDLDPARGKDGWEDRWQKRYCAGLMLLDLEDPARVVGLYREPLLAPEAPYEIAGGFRNHAIFPTGMTLEEGGEVRIYYGAADIMLCVASAHVDDLLSLVLKERGKCEAGGHLVGQSPSGKSTRQMAARLAFTPCFYVVSPILTASAMRTRASSHTRPPMAPTNSAPKMP